MNNLTNDQRRILAATLTYAAAIAEQEPHNWWTAHDREEWEADRRYGPLWSPSKWFSDVDSNAETVRLTRVLKGLEAAGLVITFRRDGRRNQHVRLTVEGERIAGAMLAEIDTP